MHNVIRALTSIPLAARVLLLGATITAALTVVAVAREPVLDLPADEDNTMASEPPTTETAPGYRGDARGGVGVIEADLHHFEGAIPEPSATPDAPREHTRHENGSRFTMPLQDWTAVTDRFGAPRGPGFVHGGIDLALDHFPSSPVFSACVGTVTTAEYSSTYGYYVMVDCGDGYTTLYGHFREIRVKVSQAVTPDYVLGISGSTGFSTGEHLHFEIRWRGIHVNPEDYLDFHIPPGTPLSSGPIVWGSTQQGGARGGAEPGGNTTGGAQDTGSDTPAEPSEPATATATATPTDTPTPTLTPTPTNTPTPTPTPLPPTPTPTQTPRPVIG
ncbi:MAG: M23 family metallopeptidase [Dehalococcoidia bacterium]|nr:M23 family metallopeptidase [Dehalococcoidia bacterium]